MKKLFQIIIFLSFIGSVNAAPYGSWYLDELGTTSSTYALDDDVGSNDGIAYQTPSSGNASGKICSALDFTTSSVNDYALIDENALDGAEDFTISIWHKGGSTNGRSVLSGASSTEDNEILMWLTGANNFSPTINGVSIPSVVIPDIYDNNWHHLVWRRSGTQSCIYTDGVQRGCSAVVATPLNVEFLVLGQDQDVLGGNFDAAQDWEGLLDEFLVFRSALTDAEILSVYNNQNAGNSWNNIARSCLSGTAPSPPADLGYSDWRFDEAGWSGTANDVIDSNGSNNGVGHSVTAVPGKICNAMDLTTSSTTDYATLGAPSLDGVSDFTVSVWHKGSSSNGKAILSGANSSVFNEHLFWFTNTTTFRGYLKNAALGNVSVTIINDDTWHHLVWRRIGVQSCIFIDGSLQGCQAGTKGAPLSITSLILGQEQDSLGGSFDSGQDWEGILDELLIFRRSLSNSQISDIYNNQNLGNNWDGTYRACPEMPSMKLTKTSVIISDPVNNMANPKRIPGAIVRYTIRAENAHATAGEDIVITDNLSSTISAGHIAWQPNSITVASPNIGGGSTTALTDSADADEGEFVSDTITVRCGDISNTGPCIVKYDVQVVN